MVNIKTIQLRNFRGASKISIDLSGRSDNKIITLIGLNESGKTTVLEGLSHFPISDKAAASIFQTQDTETVAGTFVPIHRTGVFSGEVRIFATFETSEEERTDIAAIVRAAGYELDKERHVQRFEVSKIFEFKDGDYVPTKYFSHWSGIELYVRKTKRTEFKLSVLPALGSEGRDQSLWVQVVDYLKKKIPNIVYFPNTVVDIPRKIYISKFKGETLNNSYYRRAVEHILDDSQDGLSLKTHVTDRIEKYRAATKEKSWITNLLGSDDKDKIDAVFSRLSGMLTEEVLGSWSRVFNRPVSAIRVEVNWFVDPVNDQPFIELKVFDGRSSYHLHQRSLGFRWFFSFLLFTRFGRDRERTNIFLFDEPAANLHARAQGELLNSFKMLADAGDYVIYSTHSHHMISPLWLSGAYIVENVAIDYDKEDRGLVINTKDTNITVTPYRRFVGEHGSRVSYYQPVLERLDYVEPTIVPGARQILVEGPSDFYAFSYVLKQVPLATPVTIVPGGGSGSLDTLISIALARGHAFLVLLDDDPEGKKAAERYKRIFHLTEKEVVTLRDLNVASAGKALEGLISADTLDRVALAHGNTKKRTIGLYLAELAATNRPGGLSDETLEALSEVIALASKRIADQELTTP